MGLFASSKELEKFFVLFPLIFLFHFFFYLFSFIEDIAGKKKYLHTLKENLIQSAVITTY